MSWRLAESLKQLRIEINAAFPGRSKASDGSIGDTGHSARTSDHNPNDAGVVCAIDVTHDPQSGCTGDRLAAALIKSKDKRIKYLIWNKRMYRAYPHQGSPAWTWKPYNGANAHQHHVHISVVADKNLYDSTDDWDLDFDIAVSQSNTSEKVAEKPTVQLGADSIADSQPSLDVQPAQTNEPAQQSNEGSGQQVVIQPNALTDNPLPIVPKDDKPVDVQAVAPEKSGAKKSIWATITAGLAFLGLNIQAFFSNAYATVKDNPAATLALVVGSLVVLVIYWKYQERQTKLDELREKQAHELTKLQMELAADQQRYSVNVVKTK